ncbi:hypothetical protein GCM10017687_87500 [Streptomyces echinatus]
MVTRSGGPAEYSIAAEWDGRDATGGLLPNGLYTWTLTAQPARSVGSRPSTAGRRQGPADGHCRRAGAPAGPDGPHGEAGLQGRCQAAHRALAGGRQETALPVSGSPGVCAPSS